MRCFFMLADITALITLLSSSALIQISARPVATCQTDVITGSMTSRSLRKALLKMLTQLLAIMVLTLPLSAFLLGQRITQNPALVRGRSCRPRQIVTIGGAN